MKSIKLISVLFCALALLSGCKTERAAAKTMDSQRLELQSLLPKDAIIESADRGKTLKITFSSATLFNANSNTLNAAAKPLLTHLANSLKNHPDIAVRIVGHTDRTGKESYNRMLSHRRAESIGNHLTAQGVEPARITCEGRGFREPSADNSTVQGRAQNRRMEVYLSAGATMIREAHGTKKSRPKK